MSHSPSLNSFVLESLPDDFKDYVVLDVGCGLGEWGFLIRTKKTGLPQIYGIDIWHPHLKKLLPLGLYSGLARVKVPDLPFKNKSVEISIACEILEHLPKTLGHVLLQELERITKKMIVVSAPVNYPQAELYGNPFERHVSNWTPDDFSQMGYKTKIVLINKLTKSTKIADDVRRFICKLPPSPKLIIAQKDLSVD